MKVALVLLLAALVPVVVVAQEAKDSPEVEVQFTEATILEREGKLEAAIEAYREVLTKWPDDGLTNGRAWLRLVACLKKTGRGEEAVGTAERALAKYGKNEEFRNAMHKVLGLPEVREERIEVPSSSKGLSHRVDHLRRVWKEQGVAEEEIERRVQRIVAEYEAQEAERQRIEEEKARLQEAGLEGEELERRIAELMELAEQLRERRFRKEHNRGMEGAREEFIRLAERLGIPREAAERLIEEHRRGGPERQFRRVRQFEESMKHFETAIREAHERLEHGERTIERLSRQVERTGEEGEHALARLHRHVEDLTGRVERMEQMMERAHDEVVPHVKEMMERIERLERRLGDEEVEED